jgi:hypothetical protein
VQATGVKIDAGWIMAMGVCLAAGLFLEFTSLPAFRRLLLFTGGPTVADAVGRYITCLTTALIAGPVFIIVPVYWLRWVNDESLLAKYPDLGTAYCAIILFAMLVLILLPWTRLLGDCRRQLKDALTATSPEAPKP